MYLIILFIAGTAGALVKDVLKDGYIQLPFRQDKKFYLGFLGSAFIGGTIGLVVDHSYLTAFLAGYVGFSVVGNILLKQGSFLDLNFKNKTNGQGLRNNNSSGS